MKTKFTPSEQQLFFHRYIVNSSSYITSQKVQFQGQDDVNFSLADFGNSKTSIHKCRIVTPGQENLEEWPMYLLKRVSYEVEKKNKKSKPYEIFDSNIKKLSQIKTQYMCYQILSKSHRVVKMIEIINENPNNQNDKKFFYQFLRRKEEPRIKNVCFVLQFCNDKNLKDRIQNATKPLTQNEIVIYCCQILQGLIQLKKKGILHRDLRPCNIFLHNDQVKFGDFDSAFIYKQSPCLNIKNGIDINTTPQEIVELAALSDQQLEEIGNFKLFQLQSKCDIYFFGMIIFKMIFRRDYQKKFEGTDLDYLIREKLKDGFKVPKLLKAMKMCLQSNCQKRIDLISLNEQFRQIEKHQYFVNEQVQKVYLIKEPMNLFSYNTLEDTETLIQQEIQNFINHTFTFSFSSVEHDFQADFQKSSLIRNTKLYVDSVAQILAKKRFSSTNLWSNISKSRQQNDLFIKQSQDFVSQMNLRAFFYDKLFQVILKINTNQLAKRQHKEIMLKNKQIMEKDLIFALRFFFQILSRTPFKVDKHYGQNLSYEVRNLFKNIIRVNKKAYFYNGRAKTFNYSDSELSQMIDQFYNSSYQQGQLVSFQVIYLKIKKLTQRIDSHLKKLLRQSIIDLLRPYQNIKRSMKSSLKQILFVMIILQKQNLNSIKKNQLVLLQEVIQPIFNSQVTLDKDQVDLFFQSFKKLHFQQVQRGMEKQNIQASMNLLSGVSSKHLNCLSSFLSEANSAGTSRSKNGQENQITPPIQKKQNAKNQEKIIKKLSFKLKEALEDQKMKVVVKDVQDFSQGFQNFNEEEKVSQNMMIST